jgi:ParB family chromosome partitioning protein
MPDVKKERPKHLGRGLQALINPIIIDRVTPVVPVASPDKTLSARPADGTEAGLGPRAETADAGGGAVNGMAADNTSSAVSTIASRATPPIGAAGQPSGQNGQDAPKLPPDKELRQAYAQIPVEAIAANPYQPRTEWNSEQLEELARSIRENGLVQPIVVRRVGDKYQLIAGERRFRAAQMCSMTAIPAFVREASDAQMLELALVENIHRADLNPIERAKAYQNYLNSFGLTQIEASQRLGEERSVIANYIRLLDLPEEIKKMLITGQLSMGHARAILGLPTEDLRRKLANRALAGRLSVREVERLVKKYLTMAASTKSDDIARMSIKSRHIIDLENRLRRELGTKVAIEVRRNGQRGKIIIEFYSIDEFERLTQKMGVESLEEV